MIGYEISRRSIGEVIFSHRYLLKGRKLWYSVRTGIILLGTILYQFLLTYLPAYAVGLLTSSRANMFGKLAIYTIALYLIMIAVKRVERTTDRVVNNTRLRKAQEYYVAFCQADYEKSTVLNSWFNMRPVGIPFTTGFTAAFIT